ncbi:hypothetical protein ACFQMA_15560 [Halosimplex aquaticum]|uniref:Uncharacterized protein n=1 Tax=Halosimplex aquaticum TaxID=3026162 RepID=A0ABD5Y6W0_9EURY|nr:hypothetical protein [Halosimplex aquaticum]
MTDSLDSDTDEYHPLLRPLVAVRSSFLNFVVALGVAMFATALAVSGPIAGILGVLGVSAIVYALFGELGLRAIGYK